MGRFLLLVAILFGLVFLCGLGTWQVYRLHWKEALIAKTHDRSKQPPATLAEVEAIWNKERDVGYIPVRVAGVLNHEKASFFYNTYEGRVGWDVITPMRLESGQLALINRGFIPDQMRASFQAAQSSQERTVQIIGLARNPVGEKPNRFVPNNDLAKRSFYWKSFSQLASLSSDKTEELFVPFIIDARSDEQNAEFPIAGTTIIDFPNNHLQYAITWYGLALALAGVGGYFWFSGGNRKAS